MSRILSWPARVARGALDFINPQLKAGRIPFGRTVLVMQATVALIFVGYTLVKKEIQMPWSSEPYLVEVTFPDAAGLEPGKEPLAGVAGAAAGRVVEVREENGKGIATVRLDNDLRGKIFADASASLRPLNVLQVLIVNIHPGSPDTGPLPDDRPIPADQTDVFVHIDKLTEVLDTDTQAQVRVLISEAAAALRDREPELREIIDELADLTDVATPVAKALDQRRRLLVRLTDNLDAVLTTVGERGDQLAETIQLGSQTLAVTARRAPELTEATRLLAPALADADRALGAGREFAEALNPTLDELLPVADELGPASEEVLDLLPKANAFLGQAESLVSEGGRPVALFERGTRGLGKRVRTDLVPAIDNFGTTIKALDKFKGGIAQTADLWSAAFSANSNVGPYSQVWFGNAEIEPEGLGLAPADAQSGSGDPSKMQRMLAKALELTCVENPVACLLRFSIDGLPDQPLLSRSQIRKATGG